MTDLTILSAGGGTWNCGYDDHTLPPVRPGGGQAHHIAGLFAAMGTLVAVLSRDAHGMGQHVDVSMLAAANVTTELGTIEWLVAKNTVQRQTGRHASPVRTLEVQVLAADGRYVTTGFPPHEAKDFQATLDWLVELGLESEFPEAFFLTLGIERGGVDFRNLGSDVEATEIYAAGRGALCLIASRVSAYDFFIGAQKRDLQCGMIYAPEEALGDGHFQARGFPVTVPHPDLGREFTYPGSPVHSTEDGWYIRRRAPLVGEHTQEGFLTGTTGPGQN